MTPEPTSVLLSRAETERPLPHVSRTMFRIEPKPTTLSPVFPMPTQTGGEMSNEEKAQARIDAAKNLFPQ